MPRVEWAEPAKADLRAIWYYIAEDSIDHASRVVRRLNDLCGKIANAPRMGRERPELGLALRSFPCNPYVIYYRPIEDGIHVMRILHGHRDIDRTDIEQG